MISCRLPQTLKLHAAYHSLLENHKEEVFGILDRSFHRVVGKMINCQTKRTVLAAYRRSPNKKSLQDLRVVRNKVRQTARRCANKYWQQLRYNIQNAAATGNIREMYERINKALGPTQTERAPLKSLSGEVITNKAKQMEGWVEHYSDLYSRDDIIVTLAPDATYPLAVTEELDAEPTLKELGKAVDSLSCGKASATSGIPPDLVRCYKTTLLQPVHGILYQYRREGGVLQDMRDSKDCHPVYKQGREEGL